MGGIQVEEAAPGRSALYRCTRCPAQPMPRTTFYSKHKYECPGRPAATPVHPQQGHGEAGAPRQSGQPASAAVLPPAQQGDSRAQQAQQGHEFCAQPSINAPEPSSSYGQQASGGQEIHDERMLDGEAEAASRGHAALQAPSEPSFACCPSPARSQPVVPMAAVSAGAWQAAPCHISMGEARSHADSGGAAASQADCAAPAAAPPEGSAETALVEDLPDELDEASDSQSDRPDDGSSGSDSDSDGGSCSDSEDWEYEEGDDDPAKEGSTAWYREYAGRPLYPGAKMTALQFSFVISDWTKRNKVGSNAQDELLRFLQEVALPPKNMCPPSKYKLRKQLG